MVVLGGEGFFYERGTPVADLDAAPEAGKRGVGPENQREAQHCREDLCGSRASEGKRAGGEARVVWRACERERV